MQRSKRILILSHCLLNANAKVFPLATCPGALTEPLMPLINSGAGLVQLPCPETCHLGMRRFGMTREQYDTPGFINTCETILAPVMMQLLAFRDAGYAFEGLVGVNGSPSCGLTRTCFGYRGGEISAEESDIPGQVAGLSMGPGRGVFMEVLLKQLEQCGIEVPLLFVDEDEPTVVQTHQP